MSGGSKGGTETTTVEVPKEIKEAAIDNLDIANEVAAIGYTPYRGPTVAEFNPQQKSGMMAYDQAASAFGMPSAVDWAPTPGHSVEQQLNMPDGAGRSNGKGGALSAPGLGSIDPAEIAAAVAPQVTGGQAPISGGAGNDTLGSAVQPAAPTPQVQSTAPQQPTGGLTPPPGMTTEDIFSAMTGMQPEPPKVTMGGLTGYTPAPAYDDALENMPPAQKAAVESFVMDPVTGEAPTNLSVPKPKTTFVRNEDGSIGVQPTAPTPKSGNTYSDQMMERAAMWGISPAKYMQMQLAGQFDNRGMYRGNFR